MSDFRVDLREAIADQSAVQPRVNIEAAFDFSHTDVNQSPFDLRVRPHISVGAATGYSFPVAETRFDADGNLREPILVTTSVELPHPSIEDIEVMRDQEGTEKPLKIQFEVICIGEDSQGNHIRRRTLTASDELKHRDWEAALDSIDWQGRRTVEVSIPESDIGDILNNAHGKIKLAEEHHNAHRYDDALVAVRSALKKLQHIENDERFRSEVDEEREKRVSKAMERFGGSIGTLVSVTDLGGHPEEEVTKMDGPIRRRDSELALDIGKAYVRYISRVLEDES